MKRSYLRVPPRVRHRQQQHEQQQGNSLAAMPEVKDPLWDDMWYLNRGRGLHMGVAEAWRKGATGRGVAVTILDDGIEKDHPDLIRNYDPLASTDINDNDADPNPRYDFSDSNRHGTRCAGQVSFFFLVYSVPGKQLFFITLQRWLRLPTTPSAASVLPTTLRLAALECWTAR